MEKEAKKNAKEGLIEFINGQMKEPMTIKQLHEATGYSEPTLHKWLQVLAAEQLIVLDKVGSAYYIKKKVA